jgi:hypothetical protein
MAARKKSQPARKSVRGKIAAATDKKSLAESNAAGVTPQGGSSFSRQNAPGKVALRSERSVRNAGRYDARGLRVCASGLLTRSRHKRCYLQSRLMRRCPLCGASGARVSAVSPHGTRPTARFIEDNIVLSQSRRRRCHRRCGADPRARSAQRRRQLAGILPARPSLAPAQPM